MTRHVSPRLAAYAGLAALLLIAGLTAGRVELVALAAPFALAAFVGAAVARDPQIEVELRIDRERVLEDEQIGATVGISSANGAARADVLLLLPDELTPVRPNPLAVRLTPGETRSLELPLRCDRWGAFSVGPVLVRARDPLGFHSWEARVGGVAGLRVYPSVETLHALLPPYETQVFIGNQVSRAKGEGIEFADVRPWTSGDRPRRINWRASARRDELWVNDQHPERNTDVVLFIDTFAEVRRGGRSTLDMAVRAATSLAHRYLGRKDRVGLVSFGGFLTWLVPASGTLQLYKIVDSLLQMDVVLSFAVKGVDVLPPRTLPPKALVVRADAAARSALGRGAARPPRPRLRPRRRRGLPRAVRRSRQERAGRAVVPVVAAVARVAARALRARRRSGRRVARRRSPRRSAGGGVGIQALRQARARVTLALLSVLAFAGALAQALAHATSVRVIVAGIGVLGLVFLAFVLVRGMDELLPWAVVCLVVAYTVSLVVHGASVDERAPLVATGLLLGTELASWSLQERNAIAAEPPVLRARIVALALLVGGGLATSALVIAVAAAPTARGLVWTIAGAAAAVLAVGLAVRAAHRDA